MSRDLMVVGNREFSSQELASWLSDVHRWELTDGPETVWAHPGSADGDNIGFSITGPLSIEVEDLAPGLAATVVAPKWTADLSVPLGVNESVWQMAQRVGRRLADEMAGVLFDPQEDRVIWPRSQRRRVIARSGPRRNDIEFEWAIPGDRFVPGLSSEVLEVLEALLPEGLPTRYGTYEPLQHRFDEDEDGFHSLWEAERASWAGMLFWRGSPPVRHGSVFFPTLRPPESGNPAGSIVITIDGRAFERPEWRDLAPVLLDRIGGLTGALCARAQVEVTIGGTVTATEAMAAPPALVLDGSWLGLPDHPSWLIWLSPEYVEEIGQRTTTGTVATQGGAVLALSDVPKRDIELIPWLDRFPVDLRRSTNSPDDDGPSGRHLERGVAGIQPASRFPARDEHS